MCNNLCIGKGAFSSVYLGHDKDLISHKVAIKVIRYQNITPTLKSRIEEEIRISRILRDNPHQNIVKFLDVVETPENVYIVMEYCDSGDLTRLITSGDVTDQDAKFYFRQIMQGINHLERLNIIHRDIKPTNILLSESNQIKIADFGLSKIMDNGTDLLNTFCGSPLYMAPELLDKQQYDRHIDVWALGMILYELIYCYNPFRNCKRIDTLITSMKDISIMFPKRTINGHTVSDDCVDLLKRCLDKNLKNRIRLSEIPLHAWLVSDDDLDRNTTPVIVQSHQITYLDNHFAHNDLKFALRKRESKSMIDDPLGTEENISFPHNPMSAHNKSMPVPVASSYPNQTKEFQLNEFKPGSAPAGWTTKIYDGIRYMSSSTMCRLGRMRGSSIYDEYQMV